jgi:hypothetical protein
VVQPQLDETLRRAIEKTLDSKSLDEPLKLAFGDGALCEVYEMGAHTSFGEKPQCFARVRALFYSEDLYFHRCS